jgi:hypothetical protein
MTLQYSRTRTIFVTHQFIGFHRWPDAPPSRAYLASLHRHLFKIRLTIVVAHNDRELEYHDVQDRLVDFIEGGTDLFNAGYDGWSCELVAETIVDWAKRCWPDRDRYAAEVNEDGENGSMVEDRS